MSNFSRVEPERYIRFEEAVRGTQERSLDGFLSRSGGSYSIKSNNLLPLRPCRLPLFGLLRLRDLR